MVKYYKAGESGILLYRENTDEFFDILEINGDGIVEWKRDNWFMTRLATEISSQEAREMIQAIVMNEVIRLKRKVYTLEENIDFEYLLGGEQ